MSEDSIILKGMQFYGHHGISEAERKAGGRFSLDVQVVAHRIAAGKTGKLEDTVDYGKLNRIIRDIVEGKNFRLIEELAEHICESILKEFPIAKAVHLTLKKYHPWVPGLLDYVAVELHRERPSE
ncbi:MAG: dihydroneopterin aldolase [bacterium JZ-2024 1]